MRTLSLIIICLTSYLVTAQVKPCDVTYNEDTLIKCGYTHTIIVPTELLHYQFYIDSVSISKNLIFFRYKYSNEEYVMEYYRYSNDTTYYYDSSISDKEFIIYKNISDDIFYKSDVAYRFLNKSGSINTPNCYYDNVTIIEQKYGNDMREKQFNYLIILLQ